jgi:hypothetical protein
MMTLYPPDQTRQKRLWDHRIQMIPNFGAQPELDNWPELSFLLTREQTSSSDAERMTRRSYIKQQSIYTKLSWRHFSRLVPTRMVNIRRVYVALHFASLENIALPLIAAGVDIDDEHHVGNTPENLARKRQSMEVVEALIKGRADRRKIYRVVEDVNSSRSPPLLEIKLVIVIVSTLYMYLRFSIAYDHIAVISYSRQHHTPYCSRRSRSPFFFWMAHRHIENRP